MLNLTLKIWRQDSPTAPGALKTYDVPGVSEEMSFLEMLDILNDRLIELGLLMCKDALAREESCGGHFRVEHQTEDGEALRHDDEFAYAAAWEWTGKGNEPVLHKEPLTFEHVHLATRSYK